MPSKQKSVNSGKWRRFRRNPRAMISLVLLGVLYAASLCTELICSSKPLYLKVRGHSYFPFLSFVSEKQLFGEGADAAPDWAHFESDPRFSPANGDYVLFAPIRAGTSDIMRPEDFAVYRRKTVTIKPDVKVARCDVDADLRIIGRPIGCEAFFSSEDLSLPLPELLQLAISNEQLAIPTLPTDSADPEEGGSRVVATAAGMEQGENCPVPIAHCPLDNNSALRPPHSALSAAVSNRLANLPSPASAFTIGSAKISLAEFKPRSKPPKSVRLRIEEAESAATRPITLTFERQGEEAQEPESPRAQEPPSHSKGSAGVSEGSALADPDPEGGAAKGIEAMGFKPINSRVWASLTPATRTEIAKLLEASDGSAPAPAAIPPEGGAAKGFAVKECRAVCPQTAAEPGHRAGGPSFYSPAEMEQPEPSKLQAPSSHPLTPSPSHHLTPDNCTLHIAHCALYQNSSIITPYTLTVQDEAVTWPFRPVSGHPMGIDSNGRDVFACILSGTRTAMTFGLLLVAWAMLIGIVAGAVQGYFGGWADLGCQRFIEIWSSLPFLYVMILVGDVCGRSFALLLFCYGLFNWIGVSYYVRAEFLRLRKRPFVEAAKCMGLSSWQIIRRHILPNALTPVITLLPFSLVGAIASISALDFLGFGLPPLTPSWGELLQQAQENVYAWWLILYPSAMLFFVMLFAVFVGEGLRDAFDPKPAARYR